VKLHVIVGEDDFQVEQAARKVIGDAEAIDIIDSLSSTNTDAQLSDLIKVKASFETPPLFGPFKVTWWKNVHFLPGGAQKGPSEAVKTALESFASQLSRSAKFLPEQQHFILSGPRLLKTSIFAKCISTFAEMLIFTPLKPWEMFQAAVQRVQDLSKDFGLSLDQGVAERLISCVGTDTRSISNEFAKILTYLNPDETTITYQHVAAVTSQGVGIEPEFWAVTDAIGERNISKALDAISPFEGTNGFSVLMSSMIERFFRQLLELKAAYEDGKIDEVSKGFSPNILRKNTAFLRNWSLNELRIARWRFLDIREKVVTGLSTGDTLVICEIVRVCQRTVKA